MAIEFGKGIALAGGFDLGAKAPLDSRLTVATIEERDAHVTGNRAYDGMLVFVEADKVTYQYILDEDGNGEWKEFGFNEADFVAHIANDLTTDDAAKALSAAQGVVLKGLIDNEVARAEEVEEALQASIDGLDEKMGVIPEASDATTLIGYVNEKAQEVLDAATGGSSESAASVKLQLDNYIAENDPKVAANTKAAADAQAAADVAMDAAEAVDARVDVLVGEDADKSVRTIANEELAKQLIAEGAQESLDTLAEIAAWIQAHPDDAAAMNKAIEDLEALIGTLPEGVTATTIVGYIQEVVAAETAAREAAIDGIDERLQAVEAKFGDGEGNVEAQISAAVSAEKAEREAADAQTLTDAKAYADEKDAAEVIARDAAIATAKAEAISEAGTVADEKDAEILQAAKDYADSKVDGVDLTGIATNAEAIEALQGEMETKADASDVEAIGDRVTAVEDEIAKLGTIEDGKTVVELIAEARAALEAADVQVEANANAHTDAEVAKVNATIGEVAEGKTVLQLIQEAREAAIAGATYDDTQVKADIAKNAEDIAKNAEDISALSETHISDKAALVAVDESLDARIVALESVEHVEIQESEINAMFE